MSEPISPSVPPPVPVVVHLSGSRRGVTLRMQGQTLRIGSDPEAEIRVTGETVAKHHATLSLRSSTYGIRAEEGQAVWVNGDQIDVATLQSGDILEIGAGGPVLRFRLYPPDSPAHKSLAEAFVDCIDCVRLAGPALPERAGVLLTGAVREFTSQTSWLVRAGVIAFLVTALAGMAILASQNRALEEQHARVPGLEKLLGGKPSATGPNRRSP